MREVALKRVALVRYGLGQPPASGDKGVPILRATNIERGRIHRHDLLFANLADLPIHRTPLLRAGEILVVRSGAYTGDSALVTSEWEGSAPGYDLRLTPLPGYEPRFLAYALLGTEALDQMKLASTRAAQPHLNADQLAEVKVPLPPLVEQRAIADYLDTETARIDALIAKKQRLLDLAHARFADRVDRTTGQGGPARVRHLTSLRTSGPRGWAERTVPDGKPFLRSANLRSASLSLRLENLEYVDPPNTPEATRSRVLRGDVLVGITGANTGWVGVVPEEVEGGFVSQHVAILRPSSVDPLWLAYSIASGAGRGQLLGGQYGGTKQQLGLGDLGDLTIRVPPAGDQVALVSSLERARGALESLRSSLTRQILLLQERRQATIAAAVTGQFAIDA